MLSAAVKPLRRLAPSAVAMTASHMPAAAAAGAGSQGYAFGAAAAAAAAAMMAGGSLAWCLEDHSDMVIFSGTANLPLAQEVAEKLGKPLAAASVKRFADGEVSIRLGENVRGRQVYIVQPTCPDVNKHLMELLLLISTARRSSADKITAVIPYYGYARQDRKLISRVPISAADVAVLLESMGVDRVVAVDLHCGQIQGFFSPRTPVDNLDGGIVGVNYFAKKDLQNVVVVSPDAGGVYRCKQFRERFKEVSPTDEEPGLAMIIKQRSGANKIATMDLVGSVDGCDVIIVDDMMRVYALASHGLFSGNASANIEKSCLEEVVVLNTVPANAKIAGNPKVVHISVAQLLADAMECVHDNKSISALFKLRDEER